VIPVLDQGEHDIVLCKARGQINRVLPGNIGILHALQDPHRAAGLDHALAQQVAPSVLDQAARDEIGLIRIGRWPLPGAGFLDLTLHLGWETLPHQLLGEIDCGRDQNEPHEARPRLRALRQLTRKQKCQPRSHR
jgi:hypothetical protein